MKSEFQKSISFGTAEELQEKREEDFLALSPDERFQKFLLMMQESYILFGRKLETPSENFEKLTQALAKIGFENVKFPREAKEGRPDQRIY